jgi:DNA repair photolyase
MTLTKTGMVHGTGEWATSNINIDVGCPNDCRYCYAKCMAVRFRRASPESRRNPVPNRQTAKHGPRRGRVMFPSTHDIFPENLDRCLQTLTGLLSTGTEVLIVSKPRLPCIVRLCADLMPFRDLVTFRFTVGSADDCILDFWEPGAPAFDERVASLKRAYDAGYRTSVSCEPMLDAHIDIVVEAVRPWVADTIWLGRANQLRQAIALNCPGDVEAKQMADSLIANVNDDGVRRLFERYREDPKIRWKDSLKKLLALPRPTAKGLDI